MIEILCIASSAATVYGFYRFIDRYVERQSAQED